MAKTTSLAELQSRGAHGDARSRRRASGTLARRLEEVKQELSALPMKPVLVGAGIGAALLGAALSLSSKRRSTTLPLVGLPLVGLNRTLTKTALVALARVVSGQTVRSATTSALLDVADALKS
jgi:hypothetical protein